MCCSRLTRERLSAHLDSPSGFALEPDGGRKENAAPARSSRLAPYDDSLLCWRHPLEGQLLHPSACLRDVDIAFRIGGDMVAAPGLARHLD